MTDDLLYRVTELERTVANLLRPGVVAELDAPAARVRVQSGKLLTAWLPWFTRRAGLDRDWWAPEPGEQVMLLCPDGDPAQGVVLPAIYRAAHPAPGDRPTLRRVEFADGGFIEYDRAAGNLAINVVTNATINVGGDAAVGVTGDALLTVGGAADVSVGGKATVTAAATVEIDGGSGAVKGSVQGDCLCAFTGKPHPHISATVKESM